MRRVVDSIATCSQAASYVLGSVVLVSAGIAIFWSLNPRDIADWAIDVLGASFVGLLGLLILATVYCLVRLTRAGADSEAADFWLMSGAQIASGIATLALTFTLFGISLGIGSLAGQGLSPDNVQAVIQELTSSFSLAFLTTVIGLPISAGLRTLLVIIHGRQRLQVRQVASSRSLIR